MITIRFPLACLFALSAAAAWAQNGSDPHLIPKPREITTGEVAPLGRSIDITVATNDDDRFTARDLADALKERGLKAGIGPGGATAYKITLARVDSPVAQRTLKDLNLSFDDSMKSEGYVLLTTKDGAIAIANTSAGVFYAAQTLKQLSAPTETTRGSSSPRSATGPR